MRCKICGSTVILLGNAKIIDKYVVSYFKCDECRSVMTEEPYWLEEAYRGFVDDVNATQRGLSNADLVAGLCDENFARPARVLDYGCGAGVLVKTLRKKGVEAHGYDKYRPTKNQETLLSKSYDLITAFEVFEHFRNPKEEILSFPSARAIFFSTELVQWPPQPPPGWHYYATSGGRHVFFYGLKTLSVLGKMAGYDTLHSGHNFHVLSKGDISTRSLAKLKFRKVS